jgi:hypothetical protein
MVRARRLAPVLEGAVQQGVQPVPQVEAPRARVAPRVEVITWVRNPAAPGEEERAMAEAAAQEQAGQTLEEIVNATDQCVTM